MEGNAFEAVLSAEQFLVKVNAMTEEREALEARGKGLALEVQCVPGLPEDTRLFWARVAELDTAFRAKKLKMRAKPRTENKEVVVQRRTYGAGGAYGSACVSGRRFPWRQRQVGLLRASR